MNVIQLSASYLAITLATAAMATPVPSATERSAAQTRLNPIVARESEPGDDHHKGRRLSDEQGRTTIAREAEPGDDHHKGRGRLSDEAPTTVAREASEGPRGEGKGHRMGDELPAVGQLA
jgi:hypothetical protein